MANMTCSLNYPGLLIWPALKYILLSVFMCTKQASLFVIYLFKLIGHDLYFQHDLFIVILQFQFILNDTLEASSLP